MARPSGKYFATVVNKLRDLKAQESIVIDQNFKLRLRNELMSRIQVLHEEQPERVSFLDRIRSLRYHLAAVPMLFFVVATVFAFSQLPVFFRSGEVAAPSTQSPVNNIVSAPVLETFPGETVMPSAHTSENPLNSEPVHPYIAQKETPAPVVVEPYQEQPSYVPPQVESEAVTAPVSNDSTPRTVEPVTTPAPAPAATTPVYTNEAAKTEPPHTLSASDPGAPSLNVPVRFDGNFSADEKNLAEKIYIPYVMKDKNVHQVDVIQTGMNTVVVRLYITNDGQENYNFKTNSEGGWKLVRQF